jgi:hypothetical protein
MPQLWMEDFVVACQLVPSVPHLTSDAWPSPRTCALRSLQTPSRDDALVLPFSFGLPSLEGGLVSPSMTACPAHTARFRRRAARVPRVRVHVVVRRRLRPMLKRWTDVAPR